MNKQRFTLTAAMLLALACAPALAQVTVSDPWIRATVPQQKTSGAFMVLTSARDARLVAASTPVAAKAELHQMTMDGQTMRMHAVDAIDLAAGKAVSLGSGGYHIMLLDLKRQLKEGDTVPLTLTVQDKANKRESVTVNVPVKPISFVNPRPTAHDHH